ncbi:MAG: acetyl-coenzyme A synthetase, partial [Candidatus Doudnabacteria bacterium RIFCSPHIGHO2_01_FULL_43_23]
VTVDNGFRRGKVLPLKKIVDEALEQDSESVQKVVVVKHSEEPTNFVDGRDLWYHDLIKNDLPVPETEIMDSDDPAFILYTSGTTGTPKGVVHSHGGYMVGVWRTIKWVFDLKDNDIYWCTADPGWITGHSYIVYGPLMAGVTTVMYEGAPDYPKNDRIWEMIARYKVTVFYTAPTLVRLMAKYGDEEVKKHDMSSLRLLGSVGEPINPEAWKWYYEKVGGSRCPIMDTWWQTETGMHIITPLPSVPLKPGSAYKPFPGIVADVVDKNGKPVPVGKGGFLVIKNSWPAQLKTLYHNPKRYLDTYYEKIPGGVYTTGDIARKDEDGYFWIQGRSDDVLKIAGHRISNAEIESAIVSHASVTEAGVIGKPHPIKGESAKAFVILKSGVTGSLELIDSIKKHIRTSIGPIAVTDEIEFVEKLPKTRSGKIMRRVLRAQELGEEVGDTSTLED